MTRAVEAPSPSGLYSTILVLALLDVFVTSVILALGGVEVNALAAGVHRAAGTAGLAVHKAACIGVALACVETLRRRRPDVARRVAEWAVALGALPVVVGGCQLALFGVHLGAAAVR